MEMISRELRAGLPLELLYADDLILMAESEESLCVVYLQTQFGEDWCTQLRVNVVTDPQTHKQTHRQDWLKYTVPLSLARSVTMKEAGIRSYHLPSYQMLHYFANGKCAAVEPQHT